MTSNTQAPDRQCRSCHHWCRQIARATIGNPTEAYCHGVQSPHRTQYTYGNHTCDAWTISRHPEVDGTF